MTANRMQRPFPTVSAGLLAGLALLLAWPVASASARKRARLNGCWKEKLSKTEKRKKLKPAHLRLDRSKGTFRWNKGAKGRFMSRTGKIWLLDHNGKTGELWRYRFTKRGRRLILHNPEGFRYLGRGRYFYFRFRSSRTTRRFRRLGKPGRCPKPPRPRP